ncbi:MAG: hypothetical protein JWM27_587 [Gemmatimonadetes bacterium]|nr:hypothetical protein [Gemmatimonadota bacterium]
MRLGARRAAAEGIGTFFLVLIGPDAVAVDAYTRGAVGHVGVALSFAFVVLAMVYALGHLSGAHLNPAVTLAFASAGRFPWRGVPAYVAAHARARRRPRSPRARRCARRAGWEPRCPPSAWARRSGGNGCCRSC